MELSFEDDTIIVRIPCTKKMIKDAPMSKSGKSRMVASTNGFAKIDGAPEGLKLSLNLIGPK